MAKILIVEDDRHINELIRRNLRLAGHECVCCFDGKQAQEMAAGKQYDLILLDVMLSGMSGFELISEIQDTPVIFVTAKGELKDKLLGLSLGAEDYIVKPLDRKSVV